MFYMLLYIAGSRSCCCCRLAITKHSFLLKYKIIYDYIAKAFILFIDDFDHDDDD